MTVPPHVLWGRRSRQGSGYDVLAVWREHAETVTGQPIDSGHFIPEEAPDEAYTALLDFFRTQYNAVPAEAGTHFSAVPEPDKWGSGFCRNCRN